MGGRAPRARGRSYRDDRAGRAGDARARLRPDRERLVVGGARADPHASAVELAPAGPARRLHDAGAEAGRRRHHAQHDPAGPDRHRPHQAPARVDREGAGGRARADPDRAARHRRGAGRGRGLPLLGARELHHRRGAAGGRRPDEGPLTVARDRTSERVVDVPEVAFEVDSFEWTAPDTLEVRGRWFGLRGHRFLRPTLDVQVAGQRRRMLAVLEHKPWAAEEGEEWVAAFQWTGPPARLEDAELTVSPDLAVQLPLPDGSVEDDGDDDEVPAGERRPARRPRTAVLEAELAAALAEVGRRDEELARVREAHSEAARELRERARTAQETARRLELELTRARDQVAASEAQADTKLGELRKERDAAATARDRAAAEAVDMRAERDAAVKRANAVEAERDALVDARDRARQERNAWMSRARAATAQARGGTAVARRVPAPPAK